MKRKEFEKRRKAHYNEFDAVRQARLLMQEDDDEDDDDDNDTTNRGSNVDAGRARYADEAPVSHMDVDSTYPDKPSSSGRPQDPEVSSSTSALVADEV